MRTAARALGAALVEREATLDRLFAEGEIMSDRLTAETSAIGDIHGRLRGVHLQAHLETRGVLSPEQVARYNKLRGYDKPPGASSRHPGAHRH
jgi:hypothetical protein